MTKLDEAIEEYQTARSRLLDAQARHREGSQTVEKAHVDIKRAQAPFKAAAEKLAQLLHADVSGIVSYGGRLTEPEPPPPPPEVGS